MAKNSSPDKQLVPAAGMSLVDLALSGNIRLPKEHKRQKSFFKLLRRMGSDPVFRETIQRFRDAVIRASLTRRNQSSGMSVALAGVQGGEGTSLLSLLLTLSLGACKHYRVAFLDGRFSPVRFDAISRVLDLSRNSCRVEKGESILDGYYNENHPNVYFLRNSGVEQGLEFFSDKRLRSCLSELQRSFDFLVIDMPPILKESSNTFLAPEVDSLYLVVQAGKTRIVDIDRCRTITDELGRKINGVVVNQQKSPLWSHLFWREYFF